MSGRWERGNSRRSDAGRLGSSTLLMRFLVKVAVQVRNEFDGRERRSSARQEQK
jgi:hypothetical protein